jgi:glucosyl-3-phosphoglycerate synthase
MTAVPSVLPATFHHAEFDAAALAARKGDRTIAVCLPAHDEEPTVGAIVTTIRSELVEAVPLVDEVVVVDDHSDDATAHVAEAAGARVVPSAGRGKGSALWTSVRTTTSDLVVWCDADVRDFTAGFVVGLLGPLLTRDDVTFVKGFYDRPITEPGVGGGRVTELVARPLIELLFPSLGGIIQPLAGEYAGRRDLLEQLPFVSGYGVDLGLLIDVAALEGEEAIAQVDLGVRHHRNRPLDELAPQAREVMQVALARAGHPGIEVAELAPPGGDRGRQLSA